MDVSPYITFHSLDSGVVALGDGGLGGVGSHEVGAFKLWWLGGGLGCSLRPPPVFHPVKKDHQNTCCKRWHITNGEGGGNHWPCYTWTPTMDQAAVASDLPQRHSSCREVWYPWVYRWLFSPHKCSFFFFWHYCTTAVQRENYTSVTLWS